MHGSPLLEALILAVVQGIAEFLPISSSGHLVIAGELLRRATGETLDPDRSLQLNVALHAGTLLSILWVYRTEVLGLFRRPRLCRLIVLATVPVVIVGLLAKDAIETAFATPLVAGAGLLLTAMLLVLARRFERDERPLEQLTAGGALAIGAFQAVAIVPGISRSGSTIAGGLLTGLKRDAAAAFSFLIAIPAIAGAAVLTLHDMAAAGASSADPAALLIGAATSCLVGIVALRLLIGLLARGRLHWFAWYCAVVGTATVAWQLLERTSAG